LTTEFDGADDEKPVIAQQLNKCPVLYGTCRFISAFTRAFKSRRMRWAGQVARMGEKRNAYQILVGKPEVKRPLGRPRRRWVNNIKMDLREDGMGCIFIDLAQDRDQWRALVNTVMNLLVP
jgi:hypothetical protein